MPPATVAPGALPDAEAGAALAALASQAAFDAFVADARAVPARDLSPCHASIALVHEQVTRATAAVLAEEARLKGLPGVDLAALRALPRLAQGLAWAALLASFDAGGLAFGAAIDRAERARRRLLAAAEALAEADVLPAAPVATLAAATRRDPAADCAALVELFRKNERRVAGRTHVTAADLAQAADCAATVDALLAASDDGRARGAVYLELRDRFWALLRARYELLWRCGAVVFGREVDLRVPPLDAGQRVHRRTRPASVLGATTSVVIDPRPTASGLLRPAEARSLRSAGLQKSKFRFWIKMNVNAG